MQENTILLAALFVSGWLVQRGGFCLVAAIRSTLDRRPERLLLILTVALAAGALWMFSGAPEAYTPTGTAYGQAMAGGVLFGAGAAVNRGCFFGTLTKLLSGDGHRIFSLAGIFMISAFVPQTPMMMTVWDNAYPPRWLYLVLLMSVVSGWLYWQRHHRLRRLLWLLVPGITFGFVYPSVNGWSLSQFLLGGWAAALHQDDMLMVMHVPAFLTFLAGMLCYRIRYGGVVIKQIVPGRAVMHFIAGGVMVMGARMMGGGNDSLLFRYLPALTPQVLSVLLSMCLSVAIVLIVLRKSPWLSSAD